MKRGTTSLEDERVLTHYGNYDKHMISLISKSKKKYGVAQEKMFCILFYDKPQERKWDCKS